MSAHIYPHALTALLDGTLVWTAEDIKVVLLGPSFVYDDSAIYVSELPSAPIIATSDPLAHRTYVNGVAKGDPATFLQLVSNQQIASVVVYQDTGDAQYSMLIAHWDSDSVVGAPLTPNGTDLYVYAPVLPGGWIEILEAELQGLINGYVLAGDFALAELIGGDTFLLPELILGGRLIVRTHVVCANPDESESCCRPTIRSSRCE